MILRLFLAAITIGSLVSSANATTYAVKAGGGGNFTTIQACATAMAAGDTCTVFAGTYNENVTVTAGTAGNYKTVSVNPGDTVNVRSFTLNSHTKAIGFTITNPSSPSSAACVAIANLATDIYVTNNTMTQCGNGSTMISEPLSTTGVSFIYFQGNTLSWGCSTPSAPNVCEGWLLDGNHQLLENNDISHVSDGVTLYGSFVVFRNNTMHDTGPADCGSHSSNCHIDFVESEPTSVTPPAHDNLYEGNYQTNNAGSNAHVFLTQADSCVGTCSHVIIRYNHASMLGTYWLLDQLGNFSHVKDYNNTIVCALNGVSCGVSSVDQNVTSFSGSTNGAEVNNLYYNSTPAIGSGLYYPGAAPFRANNNLAFCSAICSFIGSFTSEIGRIVGLDPKFLNSASDWHLQSGSPAIAAGASLTTAANSGSTSPSLTVADADYFQDGLGLTANGVQADWIRIGASTTVQVSSINYSTNVITLASPVSWNSGDPIYLYRNSKGNQVLFGAKPDIGAFPFRSTQSQVPSPPSNLLAIVQ